MIELVTLVEIKEHLRDDGNANDAEYLMFNQAGSAAILSFIQGNRERVIDSDGKVIKGTEILARLKVALLVLIGWLDRNRGGEDEEKLMQGYLPISVTMLIYDLRRPTIV
ncbi:phage gp6-like head-tail connector protein [Hafnia alvei]|uniref:head-tail connector protein n=1 Tax=Hafnia alvei TaxID=569 RepID=UPI000B7026F5|nr:head-tail connector protein [Hafnia alvei]MBI0275667.1 phage gp6-like head-tail connector protein [Hafnia alvei]PNK98348.1 DNA-packaging protein [Hafnia alvei]